MNTEAEQEKVGSQKMIFYFLTDNWPSFILYLLPPGSKTPVTMSLGL